MAGKITKRVSPQAEETFWKQSVSNALNEYFDYNIIGDGDPLGNVIAKKGAIFHRRDGGAGTSVYVKETETVSGVPDSTGWVGK